MPRKKEEIPEPAGPAMPEGAFGYGKDEVQEAPDHLGDLDQYTEADMAGLRANKKGRPKAKLYPFEVVCTGSPTNSAVKRRDHAVFQAPDEGHAIRMFCQKYRIDPAGMGDRALYSFYAYMVGDDHRPRSPYSGEEFTRLIAYEVARGKISEEQAAKITEGVA